MGSRLSYEQSSGFFFILVAAPMGETSSFRDISSQNFSNHVEVALEQLLASALQLLLLLLLLLFLLLIQLLRVQSWYP